MYQTAMYCDGNLQLDVRCLEKALGCKMMSATNLARRSFNHNLGAQHLLSEKGQPQLLQPAGKLGLVQYACRVTSSICFWCVHGVCFHTAARVVVKPQQQPGDILLVWLKGWDALGKGVTGGGWGGL